MKNDGPLPIFSWQEIVLVHLWNHVLLQHTCNHKAEDLLLTPSFYLNACDKGTLLLFTKYVTALSFYLPLTVCHPLIGGALPPTVHTFISRWPCNSMKPRAGFPAARLEGLFDLFKILLASRTLERCPSNTYPASISASTLKGLQVQCTSTPRASVWERLGHFQETELGFWAHVHIYFLSAANISAIFIKVHIPQKLVTVAQVKLSLCYCYENNSPAFNNTL